MQPKKTKYKKYHKPRHPIKSLNKLQNLKPYKSYNIIALESSFLNGKQIEAARQSIRRKLKRKGQLKILIFPDIAISNKSTASRMGKGKGKVNHWVSKLNAGKSIFQLTGISNKESLAALYCGANKLPFKVKICQQ